MTPSNHTSDGVSQGFPHGLSTNRTLAKHTSDTHIVVLDTPFVSHYSMYTVAVFRVSMYALCLMGNVSHIRLLLIPPPHASYIFACFFYNGATIHELCVWQINAVNIIRNTYPEMHPKLW